MVSNIPERGSQVRRKTDTTHVCFATLILVLNQTTFSCASPHPSQTPPPQTQHFKRAIFDHTPLTMRPLAPTLSETCGLDNVIGDTSGPFGSLSTQRWPNPSHSEAFARELIRQVESQWALGSVQYTVSPHNVHRKAFEAVPADLYLWHHPNTAATLAVHIVPIRPVEHAGIWWFRVEQVPSSAAGNAISLYVLESRPPRLHPRGHRFAHSLEEEFYFLPCVRGGGGEGDARSEFSAYQHTQGGAVIAERGGWAFPVSALERGRCGVCRSGGCKHVQLSAACVPASDVPSLARVLHNELLKADSSIHIGEWLSTDIASLPRCAPSLAGSVHGGSVVEAGVRPQVCALCLQVTSDMAAHLVEVHWRTCAGVEGGHVARSSKARFTQRLSQDTKWLGL